MILHWALGITPLLLKGLMVVGEGIYSSTCKHHCVSSESTVGYLAVIISDVRRCISTRGTECSFSAHICIKNLFTANLMQLITCVTNNSLCCREKQVMVPDCINKQLFVSCSVNCCKMFNKCDLTFAAPIKAVSG